MNLFVFLPKEVFWGDRAGGRLGERGGALRLREGGKVAFLKKSVGFWVLEIGFVFSFLHGDGPQVD